MALASAPSGGLRSPNADNGGRLAAVLCVFALVIFTLSAREAGTGPISSLRAGFSVITSPVRAIGSVLTAPFTGVANIYSNLTADSATLSELEEENRILRARNAELEEAELTVARLQDLLELKSTYQLKSTAARIISGSSDSWTSTVTIDKGTQAGLSIGMPVCSSTGVIGQIIECGPTSSVVRLLGDESSRIPAMVESSRAEGVLRGSVDGTLILGSVPVDQIVSEGDIIITSGLGGMFPKGLPLGVVVSVERPTGALYYTVTVEALAAPENSEEVLVITSLTEIDEVVPGDTSSQDAPQG
ncbi:MAG: rod shape-determining protein MreC [Atopobiaceae bacterium]|nr:rod shape-determining protein MreC [Atopobiaceae bacterium]